jgi:hypothetical protein
MATPVPYKRPTRATTPFTEFSKYENGRIRNFRFNTNALADFEQEAGMGFMLLMRQRAVFAAARAMLWAGLKHEDRTLTIDEVGELLDDYLSDSDFKRAEHNIDTIMMVAIKAASDQGAFGKPDEDKEARQFLAQGGTDPNGPAPVDPVLDPDKSSIN